MYHVENVMQTSRLHFLDCHDNLQLQSGSHLSSRMVSTVAVYKVYGGHITTHSKWPGGPIVNCPGEPSAGVGGTSTMAHRHTVHR